MDMIEINLTIKEGHTHFFAWTFLFFLKSPFLLGMDVSRIKIRDSYFVAIVQNTDLLSFNQSPDIGTQHPTTPQSLRHQSITPACQPAYLVVAIFSIRGSDFG